MEEMSEAELRALLKQAAELRSEEEREKWLKNLPPAVRDRILKEASNYAERAFAAASDHLWVANNVFDPMSKGEAPEKPIPKLKGGLPHKHTPASAEAHSHHKKGADK